MDLKSKLRHVPDYPKEGIDFIDITTVLQDADALSEALIKMKEIISTFGEFDLIVGPESRGFIFGVPLAFMMGKGFIPIRKKGKLPYRTVKAEYQLEYGTDILEMHIDAVKPGQKVVIVDDLLATGGTTGANIELIKKLGGIVVGIAYFIELGFLDGIKKLEGYKVKSLVKF
jgi:adenine phosphoribosyltransferase